MSEEAQAILALQLAVARDPILRNSAKKILSLQLGEHLSRETIEEHLAHDDPDRFSPASLKSFAQNINGTWTQAGYLEGKAKKYRAQPKATYVNLAYALFLAHCHGLSGHVCLAASGVRCFLKTKSIYLSLHTERHYAAL